MRGKRPLPGVLLILLAVAFVATGLATCARTSAAPQPLLGSGPEEAHDLRITISERQLNQQIVSAGGNGSGFQNPVVDLLPMNRARLTATLSTQFLGQTLAIQPSVLLRLSVVAGEVVTVAEGIDLEGIPVPSWVVETQMREVNKQIGDRINAYVRQVADPLGVKLVDLRTNEDSLELDFNR